MALLDFLTQPRLKVTRGDQMNVTPYAAPEEGAGDGLLSSAVEPLQMGAPETLTQAPQIEEKPSLLQGAIKFLTSPQSIAALGAGLNGDPASVQMAADIGARRRDMAAKAEAEQKAKADLARKNAAFKAAYQDGRFNPQAYLDAIGDEGNALEAAQLARELGPKRKVFSNTHGVFAYDENDPESEIETLDEYERPAPVGFEYDEAGVLRPVRGGPADPEYIRQAADVRREAVVSRPMPSRGGGGGGRGGSSVPPLPPGFVIEK